jgi:hypothetical protein
VAPDGLAAELLTTVLRADPLSGSLYGLAGYDDLLPDVGVAAEAERARTLASIARRAQLMPDHGLNEAEIQTLDFVATAALGPARAARTNPKRHTAVRCMAVHHRQIAPIRKSSTYTR